MSNSGFVALLMYDDRTNRFVISSSYMKTDDGRVVYPGFDGRIPESELAHVVQTHQHDFMGEFDLDEVHYIYSLNPVPKTQIGDTEVDLLPSRAVYAFGLPSTAIKSTVTHLLNWHLPVVAVIIVTSGIVVVVLLKKFVQPMQRLLDSVQKKRLNDFNESIRAMKSNRSIFWVFVFHLFLIEAVLGGLIYVNRRLLEDVVSNFTSASVEAPEIAALLSSKHHDIAAYIQGWVGFHDIIEQTQTGNFSDDILRQLEDAVKFLNELFDSG